MTPKTWIMGCSAAALAVGFGAAGLVGAPNGPARAQPAQTTVGLLPCTVAGIQAAAPADATIEKAEHLDAPVPHCRVDGYVTATNPGPNKDYFRLQLPDKNLWKGRFYFIGLGGSAGYVPTDSQIPSGNPMVKGFAVAGTDTGHRGSMLDWSFLQDPVLLLDHRDRAAHLTTQASQQITRAYYGVEKMYRYETGCSGGGRMGGEAITRHPEDYDGVLLGDGRVNRLPRLGSGMYKFIQSSQVMNREPGAWLSPAKLEMVDAHVTAACDMTDGAKDGVVWDHRKCHYDFNKLKCKAGDAPDCLTQPEITSIEALLAGAKGPHGEQLVTGWPISNMSMWATFLGLVPPPWTTDPDPAMSHSSAGFLIATTRGKGNLGPSFNALTFDLNDPKNIEAWEAATRKLGFENHPDLTQAQKTGAKVMLFVGVSSPCCSNLEMEDYVRMVRRQLGPARVRKFLAMYEFPGIGHCSGGSGPQDGADVVMQALVNWVEKGETPGPLVAHRGADRVKLIFAARLPATPVPLELSGGKPMYAPPPTPGSRDFLLCPFPQISVFDKSKANIPGAVNRAANWSCKYPTTPASDPYYPSF